MVLLLVIGTVSAAPANAQSVFHTHAFSLPGQGKITAADASPDYWQVTPPFDRQNESKFLPERPFEWEEDENENETNEVGDAGAGSMWAGLYPCVNSRSVIWHRAANNRFAFATTPLYIVIQVFRI
jgi:hypothetical protein